MDKLNRLIVNILSKEGIGVTYPLAFGTWMIAFLFLTSIFPIGFEANDDVVMLMISSGTYSGTPDFHLVFINVIYGFLIKCLYALMPGLEWYTILFCLLHIISFSLIFWIYSKRITTAFGQLLLLLLLVVLQSRFTIGLQFTTTAAIVACAGLSSYFERGNMAKILGLILFFIGSLIRFEAAMLCLGVYAPVMMFPLSGRIRSKRQFLRTGLTLSFILILPMVAKIIDWQIYNQDSDWRYYMEYNKVRGALNDNPNFSKLFTAESTYPIMDIEDLKNLANFIPDPAVLDLEAMTKVKESLDVAPIYYKFQNAETWILDYLDTILLIFVLALLLFFGRKVTYRWGLFSVGLMFVSLLSLVSLNATVKERVFLSAIIPLLLVLVLLIVNYQKKSLNIIVSSFLYLLILVTIVRQSIEMYGIKKEQSRLVSEQINLIREASKCDITPFGSALALEGLTPFGITSEFKSLNSRLVGTGWMTQVPLNQGRMDSHLDFVEEPILIFTAKSSESSIHNIQYCIEKNYQVKTILEVVAEDEFFEVIVLKKQQNEN